MIRPTAILAGLLLTACATAQNYVSPDAKSEARLRELTVAEARLKKIRTEINLSYNPGWAEIREYNAAREHLMRLRSEYGPTETGYHDLGWHELEALGRDTVSTGTLGAPTGINGDPARYPD